MMVSVNLEAKKTVDVMIEKADALNIAVSTLDNGATVLDCGVNVDGSFKAGELYTKVCLGGLADVGISIPGDLSEKFALPSVKIKTDSPSISTLGSQKAGWSVSVGDFFALGSGPARAIALKPAETYEEIDYEDKDADLAILTLEADVLPGEDVAQYIADECDVDVKNVYLLVAPTSSLVGSIQISGEPAASRYTEARLAKVTEEGLLGNIKKHNVALVGCLEATHRRIITTDATLNNRPIRRLRSRRLLHTHLLVLFLHLQQFYPSQIFPCLLLSLQHLPYY